MSTVPDPQPPRDALPRGAVACLSLAAFGSGMSLRVNDAMLPQLAREFGVSLGQASQVISLFAVAYGVSQLLFGPLGDRFGKYRVIAWATGACAVAALACALAPDFAALRVARVLAGATAAAIIPLAMAWIGDVVSYEQRQPVLARFLIGQIVGLSSGVWLGGVAADHGSWQAPYFLIAALLAGAGAALFALQWRLPMAARALRRAEDPAAARAWAEFAGVLALPWARVLLALVFVEGMCLYGPFAFIATHVHRGFGMSLAAAGSLVMLFGLGGLTFALLAPRLVARLGEVGLARGGGLLLCVSLLAIGFAPAWGWVPAGCFVLGLGFYMLHNTLQVNATQMAPERRGAAVSAFAACFFLGQSTGVSLGAWAVAATDAGRFIALGGFGLLAVAFVFAAALQRRRRPAAAAG
jgi:predicted MFS family arabinose efflux permease